ncbi:MAG: hypothetical protein A2284_10990 [Deltaproteobacteria bacterium RIFOXYA12_FULL_61_11]|nr:MAG: hypothetical protein A2284_10990 [Deltaproteobacteria bacterium RIFOXYA12_FULL_61_11]
MLFLLSCTLVVGVRIGAEAWISEDALITFRTIDNFLQGYGLRWNIDERVQVATHPLWMLVNAALYSLTKEAYTTLVMLSLFLSMAAFWLGFRSLLHRPAAAFVLLFAPWMLSKSLILYGTSGFETPLSFMLLALFTNEALAQERTGRLRWGWSELYAGLIAVNRLDLILLLLPALGYRYLRHLPHARWGRLLLGYSPAAFWYLFSVLYYGFALPNTVLAKLSAEIPLREYAREGILYAADFVRWDPLGVFLVVVAVSTAGILVFRCARISPEQRSPNLAALGGGLLVYSAYVVAIGGDFLSGRFWAPVVFVSSLVAAFGAEVVLGPATPNGRRTLVVAVACAVVFFLAASVLADHLGTCSRRGPTSSMDRSLAHIRLNHDLTWSMSETAAAWYSRGLEFRRAAAEQGRHVVTWGSLGFTGFAAGSGVTIIDVYALADPLLSRLPLVDRTTWEIGHLRRPVPRGYLQARRTGSLASMDPPLAEYYQRLRLVVAGPIFDPARLRAIAGFHLGSYDHLLEQ